MTGGPGAPVLAVGGPTATGKTAVALELAHRTGADLVNADSRQVVRRLRVGTAAPTDAELGGARCHLLDVCEPGEPFTVADWLARARDVLADLASRGVPAIVVGGTGQYIRALREGWDFGGAAPDPALRASLTEQAESPGGLGRLVDELLRLDPASAGAVDLANPRRVIRAVELVREQGGSLTAARRRERGVPVTLVVLDADREVHDEALSSRMSAMFDTGAILSETRHELAHGTAAGALERSGIGYREALALLRGEMTVEAASAAALRRTRRYVKAQRTWFRHEPAAARVERRREVRLGELADAVAAVARSAGWPR